MRFESVKAHAFGPFQNETLELATGMNVVYGSNESGKSSWHAALYAGLCGVRRKKGMPTREERDFAARRKPWDGGGWEVGVVVSLDDGRRVELRHDLAGKVDSTARDFDLAGRDYSSEIMNDGALDGSLWLGLNRRTFLSVACVRQADLLGILSNPELLQQDMQRAAATAGADVNAARALAQIDLFRRENVGSDHPASKKPLRGSLMRVEQARNDLEEARRAHASYLRRSMDVDKREQEAQDARRKADAVEAALIEQEAVQAERRLQRARELSGQFPEGAPRQLPERDEVAEQVTAALTTWKSRPVMTEPDGPTVKEYGDRIAESEAKLVAARAAVAERETQDAETRLERARKLSDRFPNGQPPRPSADGHEIELQVLRALQDWEYSSSHPIRGDLAGVSVEEIEQELAAFDEKAEPRYPSPGRLPIVMTVAFGLLCAAGIGVAAFLPDFRITGLVLLGVGIAGVLGALAWPVVNRSREQARAGREQAILGAARNSIVQRLENRRMEEARHRSEHEQRSRSLKALNDAAIACDIGAVLPADQAQALRGWQERRRELLREYEVLGKLWDELQQLLGEISLDEFAKRAERLRHDMVSLVAIADEEFLADARKRDLSSERLDRLVRETQENRIGWERARAKRQEQEEQYRANVRRVEAAADALRVAAVAAEVEATDAAGLAEALSGWQARRTRSVGQAEERSRLWDELQRNLGGNSLEEVAMEAERLRANAKKRAGEVGERALSEAMSGHPSPDLLASLRSRAKYIEDDWNVERGQLEELGKSQRSVADAEDETCRGRA